MPPTRKYADRGTVFGVSCYRQIYVTNRVSWLSLLEMTREIKKQAVTSMST